MYPKHKQALSRFRCSNHKMSIQRQRSTHDINERWCNYCKKKRSALIINFLCTWAWGLHMLNKVIIIIYNHKRFILSLYRFKLILSVLNLVRWWPIFRYKLYILLMHFHSSISLAKRIKRKTRIQLKKSKISQSKQPCYSLTLVTTDLSRNQNRKAHQWKKWRVLILCCLILQIKKRKRGRTDPILNYTTIINH